MPQFFLSYARADVYIRGSQDPLLDAFFDQLSNEASFRGGRAIGLTGFLDREQRTGASWPHTTGKALSTCSVLVPVYSPNYFSSHACGQEWHAFSERLSAHQQATGEWPEAILPVWWIPPAQELPEAARYLQHTRDQFGPEYREHGLRTLMMNSRYESQYQDFLEGFAQQVVAAARRPAPPARLPDLMTEPSAFTAAAGRTRPRTLEGTRARGPKTVRFVVAAAGRAEMEAIRTVLDGYGDDYTDWSPFHPACTDPIAMRAQGVANDQKMLSGLLPADESLFTLLEEARRQMELVVVIVDPWSVELPAYAGLFTRLDMIRSGNSAILVPGDNPDAAEGVPEDTRLKLYAFLGNWKDGGERAYREDMSSIEDFETVLGEILVDIRARIVSRARTMALVTEAGPLSRPVLTGPGS
jgi:FxsC-like protein